MTGDEIVKLSRAERLVLAMRLVLADALEAHGAGRRTPAEPDPQLTLADAPIAPGHDPIIALRLQRDLPDKEHA